MKMIALALVMVGVAACGTANNNSNSSAVKAAPIADDLSQEPTYLEQDDAKIVVHVLKQAQVTYTESGQIRPTTMWTVKNVRCSESTMELVAPGGGGFTTRTISTCVLAVSEQDQATLDTNDSEALIGVLKRAGVVDSSISGIHGNTAWAVKNLNCSESTMELVAPGGGGFNVRVIDECSFEKAL